MLTQERAGQLANALSPMVATLLWKLMKLNRVQPANALFPILTTLPGILIDTRAVQE